MVLTILAVAPVLAVLLVMAAQPLFELLDARASERDRAAGRTAREAPAALPEDYPLPHAPVAFPEALGDVTPGVRIPAQRGLLPRVHAAG
ncbi:hypothetical protein Ae168Ps1_2926c [Pseudonocardia sp. Ae168_Ps1]|uniref:hypothetical protein n=1 Tax=unclassified Pseudonocardia TaxID=2619320 RepID=UPI00094B3BA3|nr:MULTISPECIES: hypothetical protein [unclassified Pseudonocardia]OLL74540.1 hypothetical protein Ae150APs1_2918c [Pseudonocardia sp. Ae150A_Ps1]OLL80520.1 hypothetical protein Ae168Ps1_2926c [Pseudonocardia sp. Ae168_Ps1]OLL85352.1 hypothetical protein Ae263Ps1_2407 [Pseudonocardia sp. Ae263_Ps1]OLL94621.1 hypothetical protein Ae356Ps1_4518c [Pseudonocardia sp. Ae356_Ps1]